MKFQHLWYTFRIMLMPQLHILPQAQKLLWPELAATPADFVLYGGTAIALRLGHRASVDFDFFSASSFVPGDLLRTIPYLQNATPLQSSNNTLVCQVDREGPVKVSFFGNLSLGHIEEPEYVDGPRFKIASKLDLTATKLKVIQERAEFKDYFDLNTLLKIIDLDAGFAAAQAIYGQNFNPLVSLKALTYFEDGDVSDLAFEDQMFLIQAVQKIKLEQLLRFKAKPGLFDHESAS